MPGVFNGSELRLARLFHSMSLMDLADRVDKTRQHIYKLEIGQGTPSYDLHNRLAEVLDVLPEFFEKQNTNVVSEEQFHFRKLKSSRAVSKQVAIAKGEMLRRMVEILEKRVVLPKIDIPTRDVRSFSDIEMAAEACRKQWGIGFGPISNMIRLAENKGIVVTEFFGASKEIDATSFVSLRPVIVRNKAKTSLGRQRFDIAHEIGHFVMHSGIVTGDRITESQADYFAGALLMPRAVMASVFPKMKGRFINWKGIIELKRAWKVSKAAILVRARQLNLLTEEQYKSAGLGLRRNGEILQEKEDSQLELEQPEMLRTSVELLYDNNRLDDVSRELGVKPEFIEAITGIRFQKKSHLVLVK